MHLAWRSHMNIALAFTCTKTIFEHNAHEKQDSFPLSRDLLFFDYDFHRSLVRLIEYRGKPHSITLSVSMLRKHRSLEIEPVTVAP